MQLEKLSPWSWFKKEAGMPHIGSGVSNPTPQLPINRLHQEIDRLFNDLMQDFSASSLLEPSSFVRSQQVLRPQLDIRESEKNYTICMDIPGVQEKDIQIQLQGDTLVISGERKQEEEQTNETCHRLERSYGAFERLLSLPQDAKAESIDAKFDNGVLNISIPKNPKAKPEGRKIEIKKQLH